MADETAAQTSAAERVGIDYAIKLSYGVIDKSNLNNKRDLIYSLLCFGCMFDNSFAEEPDSIVKKYDCLSLPEPKKADLYELAYTIVTLKNANAELKKTWYMTFAYVLMCEAPHNEEIYVKLCDLLRNEEIFAEVLKSRYSAYIPATTEELKAQGVPAILIDWYAPYLSYCAERDEKNVTRETRECHRLLAAGQYSELLLRAEKLLAAFPDDEQIALVDIAARVSLGSSANPSSRTALLKETLAIIDDYINSPDSRYFHYYRGLTLLGLMDTVGARKEFEICLAIDEKFELALLMLKGMDKYEK